MHYIFRERPLGVGCVLIQNKSKFLCYIGYILLQVLIWDVEM